MGGMRLNDPVPMHAAPSKREHVSYVSVGPLDREHGFWYAATDTWDDVYVRAADIPTEAVHMNVIVELEWSGWHYSIVSDHTIRWCTNVDHAGHIAEGTSVSTCVYL